MRSWLIIGLLVAVGVFVQAQESLLPLTINPDLVRKHLNDRGQIQAGRDAPGEVHDTLFLPFRDDFTVNNLRNYDLSDALIDHVVYYGTCFHYDSIPPDTLDLLNDTAWLIMFNPADSTIDSSMIAPVELILFDDTANCQQPTDTLYFWQPYHKYTTFDTLTGIPTDSIFFSHDTTLIMASDSSQVINPDTAALWIDNFVYFNRSYPIAPPTAGVVTFDGLDQFGVPYSTASMAYGVADYLTSKPLNLDFIRLTFPKDTLIPLTAADSVYLSFFYQPQGVGDLPQPTDSLVLEFKADNGTWEHQWSARGDSAHEFVFVMIALKAEKYLYNGFQFRFRNFATLSGNNDHWNLDYVYLDHSRTVADSSLKDVGVSVTPHNLLTEYYAMPWNQYQADPTKYALPDSVRFTINNWDDIASSTDYGIIAYRLDPVKNDTFITLDVQNAQIPPYSTAAIGKEFVDELSFAGHDSVTVRISCTFNEGSVSDFVPGNNSIHFDQLFHNYYAYDDGSAERAYGLFGTGAQYALVFDLNEPDTLRAVQIHFAQMNVDVSLELFSLRVWDFIDIQNSATPDNILYEEHFLQPSYIDSVNGFHTFVLDEPIPVSERFFVGWQQSGEKVLNFGFDLHRDASSNAYFNATGVWGKSQVKGAVMIRPLLGRPLPDWLNRIEQPVKKAPTPKALIYPNPVKDKLFFNLPGEAISVEVMDYMGRRLIQQRGGPSVPVGDLPGGIYLIRFSSPDMEQPIIRKFVKTD